MADQRASIPDKGRNGSVGKVGELKKEAREEGPKPSPKKRRKVNHACVYCRRSHMTCDLERPCTRCIKRNIGHLCHDEPRDADAKKKKDAQASVPQQPAAEDADKQQAAASNPMGPPPNVEGLRQRGFSVGQGGVMPLVQPAGAGMQQRGAMRNSNTGNNQFAGFSDAWMTAQNFNDMSNFNSNYMITPEVSHEFNLLNDFLHTSLLDDASGVAPDDTQNLGGSAKADMAPNFRTNNGSSFGGASSAAGTAGSMLPPPNLKGGDAIPSRPGNALPGESKDKTREYYLQAADPSGNDTPEERMQRVLKAKYDAGLLKPFNYINGYARLGKYLDGHIASTSKQKILRTINQFRPKFREKAQGLTDMQLVYVEMWFEKQLMDYDRVFASMAVPACCWRRTGEIFRGNKEMAELINVPVARLRDGQIALHEILTEDSMVRYWEEFGTIAFDNAHDTLLTACTLKNPSDTSDHPILKCCFSFSIKRDEFTLPSLIVGNFLPNDPPSQS